MNCEGTGRNIGGRRKMSMSQGGTQGKGKEVLDICDKSWNQSSTIFGHDICLHFPFLHLLKLLILPPNSHPAFELCEIIFSLYPNVSKSFVLITHLLYRWQQSRLKLYPQAICRKDSQKCCLHWMAWIMRRLFWLALLSLEKMRFKGDLMQVY